MHNLLNFCVGREETELLIKPVLGLLQILNCEIQWLLQTSQKRTYRVRGTESRDTKKYPRLVCLSTVLWQNNLSYTLCNFRRGWSEESPSLREGIMSPRKPRRPSDINLKFIDENLPTQCDKTEYLLYQSPVRLKENTSYRVFPRFWTLYGSPPKDVKF